ncbi:MAG: glycosyltransferase family 39 protein [Terriglobales bacterium]
MSVANPVLVTTAARRRWTSWLALAGYCALAAAVLHLLTNGRYGYFRDELYFLACSHHLAAGYVDFAPLSVWLLRAEMFLFGTSLEAIRSFTVLAAAGEVLLAGGIARALGARRFGVLLACLCTLLAPVIVGNDYRFSMNAFEPLFWMGCALLLLLALKRDDPKLLPWLGLVAGLGVENKHSMVFFAGAFLVGLLLTPARRWAKTRWFWLALAIAFVLVLPNLIWQIQHHWPTWVDLNNVRRLHKNVVLPPLAFIAQQFRMLNPVSGIVWAAGLIYFFSPRGRKVRALGWAFLAIFLLMLFLHGKDYYLAPVYPLMFAAGAVAWEAWLSRRRLVWARALLIAAVTATGLLLLPLSVPVLSIQQFIRYQQALGLAPTHTESAQAGSTLPQSYSDQFGWRKLVAAVATVYDSLPPAERADTAIFGGSYGDAGAVDFFGPRYGLPPAISTHQNYWFWGPRAYTGAHVILLHWPRSSVAAHCSSFTAGPALNDPLAMPEEHYTIWLCNGFHPALQTWWRGARNWN